MDRPTLVLITTDQLRADALGCFGGRAVATPHLDALAAESTVFDQAYTASPYCLPSRSSMMTGCYPHRHRAYSNFRDVRLSPSDPNLYNTLSGLGYHVTHVGKCHYAPVPYGRTRPDETQPYQDFRDYYLSLGIDDLDLQDDKQVSVWFRDDYAADLDAAGHLQAYRDAVWDSEAAKVFTFPGPAEWHPDAWVGRKACERIAAADQQTPQFFWISISGPHFPFDPPQEYLDRVDLDAMGEPRTFGELEDPQRIHYRSLHAAPPQWIESGRNDRYTDDYWRRLRQHYFANVALIDDQIGAIRQSLADRFGDNVMIIFTPDHGEMLGNHGMWGKGHCFYDDVLKVPLIMRRPGGRAAGTRSDDLVSLIDLYPTFVGAAGGDRPEVDGVALTAPDRGHPFVLSEGERMSVVSDRRHKLVSIQHQGQEFTEMFDRDADPDEIGSIAGDDRHATVERDLHSRIAGSLLGAALA
ncbi:sulfatase-like hydrolase/transferase [Microlunatus soli]|uniref:Arylsulfatase A n=1 Tax=Microlunatus soli TaxID=630515 RepID=A0A1H1Z2H6_9ACTN|nr:sulfatase-like hydrolase/transferase [Microlunatus soli]SDT27880.1 Arylsulfatase A [Microlunatus soli]